MNLNSVSFSLLSWNVRGLGDSDKCKTVRDTIISARLDVACLQEMKLRATDLSKAKTFLPLNLAYYKCVDVIGACGGLITAWDTRSLTMTSFIARQRSLTTYFTSTASGSSIAVTNIYAPVDHRDSVAFLEDLAEVAAQITGSWILMGDFNLTRGEEDNSNGSCNQHLVNASSVWLCR